MYRKSEENKQDLPTEIANAIARVANYTRKSSRSEGGQSKSTAEQSEFNRDVCLDMGFDPENVAEYEEVDGTKGDHYWRDREGLYPPPWRPELTRLVEDIEAGLIRVVVVWRTDRLHRSTEVWLALKKIFRRYGVRLISDGKEVDFDSPDGNMNSTVEAATNQQYRDKISQDVRRDHLWKARRGMFSGNPSCVGFRSLGNKSRRVESVPEEIALVRRIFTLHAVGENGVGPLCPNAIRRLLLGEGVIWPRGYKGPKARHPDRITVEAITRILRNAVYIGCWRHNGTLYKCDYFLIPTADGTGLETVIPLSLWEAVQEKLKRESRPGRRNLSADHLLTGIVVCGGCGWPLTTRTSYTRDRKGTPRDVPLIAFTCSHRWPNGNCEPFGRRSVREPVLDEWVIRELAPELARQIREIRSSAGRDADLQALAELDRRIAELVNRETKRLAAVIEVLDKEQIAAIAREFRGERELLQRKASEIRSRLDRSDAAMPDMDADSIAEMPKATLKNALKRAVQWIAVTREGVVAHTNWGTYIAAEFDVPQKGFRRADTYIRIGPATPAAVLRCLTWLPRPELFVEGRRGSLGKEGEKLSDAEILPGVFDVDNEYIPEVDGPDEGLAA